MTDRFKIVLNDMENVSRERLSHFGFWNNNYIVIIEALTLAQEAEQLRKERDELAVALIWYDTAIQKVPELTVRHNKDMVDAIELAKKVSEQNGILGN